MEMKQSVPRRLSGVDAAFLYLERQELPLHIACVSVFDGPIPFDEFVANIESKLHLIPRYQQIAVPAPFNIGHPIWDDDPRFNIGRHIFRAQLAPPGGEAELEELASRILSEPMDRGKPLWDLHVVDGLSNGRGALIVRIHHALADGVSGASIVKVILDPTPEGSRAIAQPRPKLPKPAPAEYSAAEALRNAIQGCLESVMAAEAILLDMAQGLAGDGMKESLQGLLGLLPELAAPVERLPFNKPCAAGRRFCWAEMDFADVQAIRAALGGTVNDVVLTVVTRAIARYVKMHGQTVTNRLLHVICPVNVRKDNDNGQLGNRITFMPVVLPLGLRDPARTLKAVSTRMEIMKGTRAAHLVALAASWLGAAPPPLQALFWSTVARINLPLPLFNLICTNVPGSPVPLYTVGRRMLTSYPHVPTGYELGVNCAAQSYDGKLFFGLTADAQAAPDVARLRDFIGESFSELARTAGVQKAPDRTPPKRPRKPRAARPSRPVPPVAGAPAPEEPQAPPPGVPEETPVEVSAQAAAST
jgi:diacylglycerol O-acyltransferase